LIISNVLPSCWLHALVTPVFKKGVTSNPCNYRPISLTVAVLWIIRLFASTWLDI